MQAMDSASTAAYEQRETKPDRSRVDASVSMIAQAHERLEHQISRLADRLVPLLQPEMDAIARLDRGDTPETPKSPHVSVLDAQSAHANAMADTLSSLIDRLEI